MTFNEISSKNMRSFTMSYVTHILISSSTQGMSHPLRFHVSSAPYHVRKLHTLRHDQLTLLPPELHATYTPTTTSTVKHAADGDGGEAQGIGVRSGIDGLELLPADYVALHGTFSAECVIRRATRSLEVLEILSEPRGFESPRGRKLTESILSDFEKRLSGHRGRSLPSSHVCTPVRLDASERARADFFDLGIGDRVLSAEGEATVMGATR